MTSGVKFEEVYNGRDDVMKLGTAILFQEGPGGAAAVLPYRERVAPPGQRWSYASSETFVLALVLRGATGENLSDYTRACSGSRWAPSPTPPGTSTRRATKSATAASARRCATGRASGCCSPKAARATAGRSSRPTG